jgi:hypothetical protein
MEQRRRRRQQESFRSVSGKILEIAGWITMRVLEPTLRVVEPRQSQIRAESLPLGVLGMTELTRNSADERYD